MLTRLALLSLALAHPNAATSGLDASGAVDDALTVAGQSDCGGTPCAALLVGWSFHESGWGKLTLGDCKDPSHRTLASCAAFGAMQTVAPDKWLAGATPALVAADRVLSFRVGLVVIRKCLDDCKGNLRAAMGLYSSGKACGWAQKTVAYRCSFLGC